MPLVSSLDRSQLEAFWMPFTDNRQFKANPRLLARAAGMHYWTADGRQILDGCAGLWCVNAGHGRQEITDAVSKQIATMDYAPPFQMGHPAAFELASAVEVTPGVFYGSENVEALHRRAVTELATQFGIGSGDIDLIEGAVPQAIADAAAQRRAELVVVGVTQRRGARALTHGSTAEWVAGEVSCDVLIVPAPPDSRTAMSPRSNVG